MLQVHHASYNTSAALQSLLSPTVPPFHLPPLPPLRCPSLHALVAKLVAAQVDFCNGLVDPKGFSEGLQNWNEAHGQVGSRLVGVSLHLFCYALSTGSSACLAQAYTRNMPRLSLVPSHVRSSFMSASSPLTIEHICVVICFYLGFNTYIHITHSNSFSNTNTLRISITHPKENIETWKL